MPMNPAALARLSASPDTVKQMQKWLALPETGQLDPGTAAAIENFQQAKGWDADFGMNGDATDWNTLTSAMSLRAPAGPNPAMEDPKYAAFLRTSGIQTANIKNEILARIQQADSERNRAAAGYATQKNDTVQQIGQSYEDRGFYNSGIRQKDQADASGKIDFQRQQEEAARTDALDNANRTAQGSLAAIGQQTAEEETQARTRINQQRSQQAYNPAATVGA